MWFVFLKWVGSELILLVLFMGVIWVDYVCDVCLWSVNWIYLRICRVGFIFVGCEWYYVSLLICCEVGLYLISG